MYNIYDIYIIKVLHFVETRLITLTSVTWYLKVQKNERSEQNRTTNQSFTAITVTIYCASRSRTIPKHKCLTGQLLNRYILILILCCVNLSPLQTTMVINGRAMPF